MKQKKRFRFPLQRQMILFYIFVGLFPVLLICIYFSQSVRTISISQTSEIYRHSVEQVGKNLLKVISESAQSSFDTANKDAMIGYLTDYADDDYALYNRYAENVQGLLRQLQYRFEKMRVNIYTPNTNIKFSGTFVRDAAQFSAMTAACKDTKGIFQWNGIRTEYGEKYLSGCAPIHNYFTGSGEVVGVLQVSISVNELYEYIDEASSSGTVVLLLDEQNQALLSSVAEEEKNSIISALQQAENSGTLQWNSIDYLIFRSKMENAHLGIMGWQSVHLVPLQVAEEGSREVRTTGIVIGSALAVIALTLLVLFAHRLTGRLKLLSTTMSAVENGDTNVLVPVTGHDEIYDLGRHFETMLARLHFLMSEIYETEIKKQRIESEQKSAQLIALQSQINPHYLFNTMETIRMNLLLQGDKRTAGVIRMFADSFREIIDDSSLTCRLRNELDFVQKYFQVQKYRYEEKINLIIAADDTVMNAVIPKFLLQPLVENAVYHGLELKTENGRILIHVERDAELLRIRVEDDGVGMKPEELAALRHCLQNPKTGGTHNYALRNIARRLIILYGDAAELKIDSTEGWGTCIRVSIPYSEEPADIGAQKSSDSI